MSTVVYGNAVLFSSTIMLWSCEHKKDMKPLSFTCNDPVKCNLSSECIADWLRCLTYNVFQTNVGVFLIALFILE